MTLKIQLQLYMKEVYLQTLSIACDDSKKQESCSPTKILLPKKVKKICKTLFYLRNDTFPLEKELENFKC